MRRELKPIAHFDGKNSFAQDFFNVLINKALDYKFRNSELCGLKIVNEEDLEEAIFGISHKDKLNVCGKEISGQEFQELFITCIFCKYLEQRIKKEEEIFICIPPETRSYDTTILIANPINIRMIPGKQKKEGLVTHSPNINFQIKTYLNFEAYKKFKKDGQKESVPINPKLLHLDRLNRYKEDVLYYFRGPVVIDTDKLKSLFSGFKSRSLFVIAKFEENNSPRSRSGENILRAYKNKFNFLINDIQEDLTYTVCFDEPAELIPVEKNQR